MYISVHNFSYSVIYLPKIIEIDGDLMKFWQKQFVQFFLWHGVEIYMQISKLRQNVLHQNVMRQTVQLWESYQNSNEAIVDAAIKSFAENLWCLSEVLVVFFQRHVLTQKCYLSNVPSKLRLFD